jgi:hypothetical protein
MVKDCQNKLQELFEELNPKNPEISDKEWLVTQSGLFHSK